MTGPSSRLAPALGLIAVGSLVSVGCGEERPRASDISAPAEPGKTRAVSFPARGMRLRVPVSWKLERRRPPAVFRLGSGEALVSSFAYPREQPLPEGKEQLEQAEMRLITQTRKRDLLFRVTGSRRFEVQGAPAIELRGIQRISRQLLRTRSVHIFKGEAEYVFEALAPAASFRVASRGVLAAMLRSARLSGKITVREPKRRRRPSDAGQPRSP